MRQRAQKRREKSTKKRVIYNLSNEICHTVMSDITVTYACAAFFPFHTVHKLHSQLRRILPDRLI